MPHILTVDDQEPFLRLLSAMLAANGYDSTSASSAEEALEALSVGSFDLLLADVCMNPMNGIALLAEARNAYPGLPVIMMTGHGTLDTALEALKLGAFDYLTKPFNFEDMIRLIEQALAWSNGQQEGIDPQDQPEYVASDFVCNSKPIKGLWDRPVGHDPGGLASILFYPYQLELHMGVDV